MFYTVGHPWQCKYRLLIQILILDALIQSLSSIKLTTKCDLAQRAGSGIRVNKGMCPLSAQTGELNSLVSEISQNLIKFLSAW